MDKVSTDIRDSVASRLLQQFWLCEGLSASDLTRIARVASFRSMARGEVVIDYGGRVHDVYCVLGGMLKLVVNTGQRNEKIVELVSAGQTIGEALLFLGQPSPARAVAIDDGRLLVLPGSVPTDMLDSSPGLAAWWLRRVSQRIGGLLAELKADAGQSAAQRIVRWLVAKVGARSGETRIRLDISKANLAASLNMTPESFSRVLKHLRQEGLVRVEAREIVVPNPARLRYLQPCAFGGTPGPESELETPDGRSEWERLVALRSECDVPHWFGDCDCDDAMPHWCGGVSRWRDAA